MENNGNEQILEFILAVLLFLFVIPVATFSVRRQTVFRKVEIKWVFSTAAIGFLLMAIKHFVRQIETLPFGISPKKALFVLSITSVNFILTSLLLSTERWWKNFEFIRDGVKEQWDT